MISSQRNPLIEGGRLNAKATCARLLPAIWALLLVIGQTTQNVSLPIWNDSLGNNGGPYFILFYATAMYSVLFFAAVLVLCYQGKIKRTDIEYPQLPLILIGVCDAANGILVVYASSPARTAPFLQSILGNFTIPMTILFRYLILKKRDNWKQLACAGAVLGGLFLSLVPSIFGLNKGKGPEKSDQTGAARILWPLAFMIAFVPAAIMNVIEEKALKDKIPSKESSNDRSLEMGEALLSSERGVNSTAIKEDLDRAGCQEPAELNQVWLLAFTSLYQFITIGLTFWTDIIPGFGISGDIHTFGHSFVAGFKCNFGGESCGSSAFAFSTVFIGAYMLSYIAGAALLRSDENGATWQAIVVTLVTPLGALFWTLFQHGPPVHFEPEFEQTTWYSVGGLVLMLPAMLLYHLWGAQELHERHLSSEKRTSFVSNW
eukprot:gb/GECG01000413.1/.p1 GENE.gb/GECG01000413.1/~~gb/GECG01000413.1/.p1  ORF type:complete len:431 (+),score=32.07 gb/GECG01000413.1/:1-1293(+)